MPKQRTKADIAAIRAAIVEILTADHPQTVRQVFYQLVVRGSAETAAKLCAEQNIALRWPNPLGMSVISTYNDPEIKEVYTRINGRRRRVNVTIGNSPEINGRASVQAAVANLTHSCDAAHLQMVALAAAKEGIQIVSVHDCFGCLAPRTDRFKEIINEQFYQLHEHHNMLVGLRHSRRSSSRAGCQNSQTLVRLSARMFSLRGTHSNNTRHTDERHH